MGSEFTIRPFASIAEFKECVRFQEETWGEGFSERVPVAIMPGGEDYEGFRKDFPRINAYFALRYRVVGDFKLGARDLVRLLVNRDIPSTGEYRLHRWPCFR